MAGFVLPFYYYFTVSSVFHTVVLSDPSTSNAQTFRGFLVQARVVADSATVGVGTFAVVNSARSRPSFCTPTDVNIYTVLWVHNVYTCF